jgi:hypothetical protein
VVDARLCLILRLFLIIFLLSFLHLHILPQILLSRLKILNRPSQPLHFALQSPHLRFVLDEEKLFLPTILKMQFLDASLIMSLLLRLLQSSHLLQVLQLLSEGFTTRIRFSVFLFRLKLPNLILIRLALRLFLQFCIFCLEHC